METKVSPGGYLTIILCFPQIWEQNTYICIWVVFIIYHCAAL